MLYFILYVDKKVNVLCGGILSDTMADQAFYQVYKNNDIYKDSVKLLSASGESQEDMA